MQQLYGLLREQDIKSRLEIPAVVDYMKIRIFDVQLHNKTSFRDKKQSIIANYVIGPYSDTKIYSQFILC